MKCIFCGGEFYSSREADKVCTPCERAIERLHIGMTPDRLFELAQAERAGRLVVMPGAPTPGVVCDGDPTGDPGEPGLIGPPRRRDGERRRPEMAEYIERTGLIADMDQAILDIPSSETVDSLTIYAVLRDCACEAPAADVEPVRHGRWVDPDLGFARCSLCDGVQEVDSAPNNYCPSCGAKMDGEEVEP